MTNWLNQLWYGKNPFCRLMYPLSVPYRIIARLRRFYQSRFRQQQFEVPLIVVGNITAGGAGKTPLVMALLNHLRQKGYRVGVVSRGYKAKSKYYPRLVDARDSVEAVGDEPLLIARKTGCPVVIDPDRVAAVEYLLSRYALDIIISDDGLQHYRMGRNIEIAVVDGNRGLGNGMCLPAGPLREGPGRLSEVDLVVVNGGQWPNAYTMDCQPVALRKLNCGRQVAVESVLLPVLAICGIGNPARFYQSLQSMGLSFEKKEYPDHYSFSQSSLPDWQGSMIMTDKDAIKCEGFAPDNCYSLMVEAKMETRFWTELDKKLKKKCDL